MFYRLEIENFFSIRDRQVIDLRTGVGASDEAMRLAPLWPDALDRAPKIMALFGANASGKSNVLKALSFIAWFVKDSFSALQESRLPFDRFNDAEMLQSPTRLAVYFSGLEDLARAEDSEPARCEYVYEVTIGGGPTPKVDHESLHYRPKQSTRRAKLFERDAERGISLGHDFGASGIGKTLGKYCAPAPASYRLWHNLNTITRNISETYSPKFRVIYYYTGMSIPKSLQFDSMQATRISSTL